MPVSYRFAICNELFQNEPFERVCKQARAIGYDGLEIAPFTLAEDPAQISPESRVTLKHTLQSEGIEFVGLHWLFMAPAGLHITTPDEAVRKRSWDYMHHLIDLCADLANSKTAEAGVMVLGSPQQRSAVDGASPREAVDVLTHELAHAAPHAESCGVKILLEALPASQTNVVNSLADAVAIVKQIGSPSVQTMFDTHNSIDEKDPGPELIRKYLHYLRHIHVNEFDGREPGMGDYDFGSLLDTLTELNYSGWVSVEAFDFSRDPQQIAARALNHLKSAHGLVASQAV